MVSNHTRPHIYVNGDFQLTSIDNACSLYHSESEKNIVFSKLGRPLIHYVINSQKCSLQCVDHLRLTPEQYTHFEKFQFWRFENVVNNPIVNKISRQSLHRLLYLSVQSFLNTLLAKTLHISELSATPCLY